MAKRSNKSTGKTTSRVKPDSGSASIKRRYGCGGKIKK